MSRHVPGLCFVPEVRLSWQSWAIFLVGRRRLFYTWRMWVFIGWGFLSFPPTGPDAGELRFIYRTMRVLSPLFLCDPMRAAVMGDAFLWLGESTTCVFLHTYPPCCYRGCCFAYRGLCWRSSLGKPTRQKEWNSTSIVVFSCARALYFEEIWFMSNIE